MSIEKFNKNVVSFKHQPAPGANYYNLEDLYKNNGPEKVYPLCGLYINKKSKYGERPAVFTAGWYANLPRHMVEQCEEILNDPDTIQQINEGLCGWRIYTYKDSNGKERYSVRFVDLTKKKDATRQPARDDSGLDFAGSSLDISSDDLPF